MTRSFYPPRRTLMGPGPSDVSPRVLGALARPTLGHLDPLFVQVMDEIKGFDAEVLQTSLSKEDEAKLKAAFGAEE